MPPPGVKRGGWRLGRSGDANPRTPELSHPPPPPAPVAPHLRLFPEGTRLFPLQGGGSRQFPSTFGTRRPAPFRPSWGRGGGGLRHCRIQLALGAEWSRPSRAPEAGEGGAFAVESAGPLRHWLAECLPPLPAPRPRALRRSALPSHWPEALGPAPASHLNGWKRRRAGRTGPSPPFHWRSPPGGRARCGVPAPPLATER